jgi:hypothetical protein
MIILIVAENTLRCSWIGPLLNSFLNAWIAVCSSASTTLGLRLWLCRLRLCWPVWCIWRPAYSCSLILSSCYCCRLRRCYCCYCLSAWLGHNRRLLHLRFGRRASANTGVKCQVSLLNIFLAYFAWLCTCSTSLFVARDIARWQIILIA